MGATMQRLKLAYNGHYAKGVGYGCLPAMVTRGRRDSVALREALYGAGLRRMKVERMYGLGRLVEAEDKPTARHGVAS